MAGGPQLQQNDRVGSWIVDKHLGTGGQATVWKVRHGDERHSAPGALKLCSERAAKSRTRFQRECQLLKENKHPGIVAVRDVGQHQGFPFYVMELANTSLDRLPAGETAGLRLLQESSVLLLDFFRQACSAVGHLHARGVLHRDLKPSNILLVLDPPEPMRALVGDLGIASPADDQGQLTGTHETVGTPIYRAPEAARGPHTKQSDVYSLGKTLEFLFTRKIPSTFGPAVCPRDARYSDAVWDTIDGVLARACAHDPAQRYRDAGELVAQLPALLVTCAATPRAAPTANTVTLDTAEACLLAIIIGACPTDRESIGIAEALRQSGLQNYSASMSLRRLVSVGFIELFDDMDWNGNEFHAARATPSGFAWASSHPREMARSTEASEPNPDDIPF